jgi:ArsR family transcriptional regulator
MPLDSLNPIFNQKFIKHHLGMALKKVSKLSADTNSAKKHAEPNKKTSKTSLNRVSKPSAKAGAVKKSSVSKPSRTKKNDSDLDLLLENAAETFRVMSAPMRLKIINSLCEEEKNVGQLLDEIDTTQPNMSQHLNTLFKNKILGRRREGVQIYYRIINKPVVALCRALCTQIAIDSDTPHP